MKSQIKISPALVCSTAMILAGCPRTPSVDVFGSFFPVWMFCLAGGVSLTLAIREGLVRARLDREIGPRPLIYPSMAVLFTCLIWMVLFHD